MEQEEMDIRLWDYIDKLCTESDARQIETLLQTDNAWTQRYNEFLQVNIQLRQAELSHPSLRFSQNVMDEVQGLPTPFSVQSYINTKIIKGIAATFILILSLILIYSFTRVNWQSGASSNYFSNLTANFRMNDTMIHSLIGINILFVLVFIDRISAFFSKGRHAGKHT